MVDVVKESLDVEGEEKEMLDALIVALSYEAGLPYQAEVDEAANEDGQIAAGRL